MQEIENLIPHSGDMVLLDKVIEVDADSIHVQSTIGADNAFLEREYFYTFLTLEMMAQSLVVFRGLGDKESRQKLGFLLGARGFKIFKPFVRIGDTIDIITQISMQDKNGLGVYDSRAYCKEELIAEATISVLNPNSAFLEQILESKE